MAFVEIVICVGTTADCQTVESDRIRILFRSGMQAVNSLQTVHLLSDEVVMKQSLQRRQCTDVSIPYKIVVLKEE